MGQAPAEYVRSQSPSRDAKRRASERIPADRRAGESTLVGGCGRGRPRTQDAQTSPPSAEERDAKRRASERTPADRPTGEQTRGDGCGRGRPRTQDAQTSPPPPPRSETRSGEPTPQSPHPPHPIRNDEACPHARRTVVDDRRRPLMGSLRIVDHGPTPQEGVHRRSVYAITRSQTSR